MLLKEFLNTHYRHIISTKSRGFSHTPQNIMEEYNGCSVPQYTAYGLKVGGGRTRIRTRVFGLEGQSDIQLHYTSLL